MVRALVRLFARNVGILRYERKTSQVKAKSQLFTGGAKQPTTEHKGASQISTTKRSWG